jgi:hypothetical protein
MDSYTEMKSEFIAMFVKANLPPEIIMRHASYIISVACEETYDADTLFQDIDDALSYWNPGHYDYLEITKEQLQKYYDEHTPWRGITK